MSVVGQTLFLGASVVSFSSNIGWGGNNSSITVELIEDFQPFGKVPFRRFDQSKSADYGDPYPTGDNLRALPSGHPPDDISLGPDFYTINYYNSARIYPDNHYYDCEGDDCYINEVGEPYVTNISKEKNVPGKIYYEWENNRFVSKYWPGEDPGFFATGTRINPNGKYEPLIGRDITGSGLYIYDIINTPVYFKFDNFEFIGLVRSWERNNRPGSITYSVTIESFDSLLDNCYVILDKYGGSIFGSENSPNLYEINKGGPVNDININTFKYTGNLSVGSIPNIFNVYGFLESFGMDFFGTSNFNDEGMRGSDIATGLSVLTSSYSRPSRDAAFSPFGRIVTKSLADMRTGDLCSDIKSFGIISPVVGNNRNVIGNPPPSNYNLFSLDISELSSLLSDYRVSGSKSISDLLRNFSEVTGVDYVTKIVPVIIDDAVEQFVIKIITVDRTSYRSPYEIRDIITKLENDNYQIVNSSFGQEVNNNITHKFIIGGPQQRLYQVKNYRLSHTQTNYIYNPMISGFVKSNKPWSKARVPDLTSTRNQIISNLTLGPTIGNRINITDIERSTRFNTIDDNWKDSEISFNEVEQSLIGNYQLSINSNNPYYSSISTTGDLKPDVREATPDKQCYYDENTDVDLKTQFVDTTCLDYQYKPCPVKNRETDSYCKDTQQGVATDITSRQFLTDIAALFAAPPEATGFIPAVGYDLPVSRYLNLQNDYISPYFGNALENTIPQSDDSNEYRRPRPVFLDIWTNQIVVGFDMHDLPQLSIGQPLSLYDLPEFSGSPVGTNSGGLTRGTIGAQTNPTRTNPSNSEAPDKEYADNWKPISYDKRVLSYSKPGFSVTESEMRACLESFDSYLSYCLGKSKFSKPDLFLMLVYSYHNAGSLVAEDTTGLNSLDNPGGNGDKNGLSRGSVAVSNNNIASNGITGNPASSIGTNLQMNWSIMLNNNFIKDLNIIYEFIRGIADTYYGKKYLVKLPGLAIYKDQQYSQIRIPGSYGDISVYTGSNKLFYQYELADGAWEEHGNFIDDCIVVGDQLSKILCNDDGLIGPIVGYNNSLNYDDVKQKLCEKEFRSFIENLFGGLDSSDHKDGSTKNIILQNLINKLEQINQRVNESVLSFANQGLNIFSVDRNSTIINEIIKAIDDLYEKIKKERQTVALKQVQVYGTSFECYSRLTQQQIYQAWNEMFESMKVNAAGALSMPEIVNLPQQWKKAINNTINKVNQIIDSSLLDLGTPSLDISSLGSEAGDFVIVPVSPRKDPFDRISPRSSKLFAKCSTEKIIFMDILNLTDPRAVVSSKNLTVHDSSLSYSKDPGNSIVANIAIEDSAIYIILKNRLNKLIKERNDALRAGDERTAIQRLSDIKILKEETLYIRFLKDFIVPEIEPLYLLRNKPSGNPTPNHARMRSRAAHPYFYSIPLKSNQFCYGPWTNYADNIIPSPYINNLVHKAQVDYNSDLVPWKYGGSSALDKAVGYLLNTDINYQTVLENGRLSIVGPPIFGLGGVFNQNVRDIPNNYYCFDNTAYRSIYSQHNFTDVKRDGYYNLSYHCIRTIHRGITSYGPLISNIGVQVGTEGAITTYSFQTYNPKTGLYNKTYSEAIQQGARDYSKLSKAIADIKNTISNKKLIDNNNIINKARTNTIDNRSYSSSSLYGKSPTEIFVGQATEILKNPIFYTGLGSEYRPIYDIGDYPLPDGGKDATLKDREKFLRQTRHYSWVGASMANEVGAELLQEFNNKSAMSLDGLLSPVSLYPTNFNRTYNLSTYVAGGGVPVGTGNLDTACPVCYNTRKIKSSYIDYFVDNIQEQTPSIIEIACPACSRAKLPINLKTLNKEVNLYSLNPILVSSGEFRNPYASGEDRCRHSISVVSRGEYNPIDTSFYIADNINSYVSGYNPDFSRFDTKIKELNNINVLLNQRFFSLRGPLMLHGWGFNKDGFPIPNADDMEYKIDKYGRALRFQLVTSGNNLGSNDLDLPGLFIPSDNAVAPLGDIITKRYKWIGEGDGSEKEDTGRWQKKNQLSKYFYLNWAERPDKWPVGPIDLRWDESKRVWDASGGGCKEEVLPPFIISDKNDLSTLTEFLANRDENKCPHKMVYLTLEQDMIREDNFESTIPARAFIDDIEYSKEPLQNNYRRLVYVIDTAGYTAPKGTKLLCRYNRDNGFYEPITKPILTAFGTITGTQANIQMSYTQGRRSGVVPTFTALFANPLKLTTGDKGLFNYINGQWTLISTG